MNGLRLVVIFIAASFVHVWLSTSVASLTWGVAPHLLILMTISFSVLEGRRTGEVAGFLWGFYLDVLGVNLFGANCLLFTVMGYLAGNLRRHMDVNQPLPHAAVAFFATLGYHFGWGALSLIFGDQFMLPGWRILLFQPLVNAFLGPLVLFVVTPSRSRGCYA